MVQARWNGAVIADSGTTVVVDGNHYFPPASIDRRYLEATDHRTVCPWKGTARYFNLNVDGAVNPNAAWVYPDPKPEAELIRDHVAFWKGVTIG